jgi:hypothetical protein
MVNMNDDINIKKYLKNEFIVKFFLILSMLYIFFLALLYPINKMIENYEPKEGLKIYMKGIINNPESLYISANNYFKNNQIDKAKIDINLAMGLIGYRCNIYNNKICNLSIKINNLDE